MSPWCQWVIRWGVFGAEPKTSYSLKRTAPPYQIHPQRQSSESVSHFNSIDKYKYSKLISTQFLFPCCIRTTSTSLSYPSIWECGMAALEPSHRTNTERGISHYARVTHLKGRKKWWRCVGAAHMRIRKITHLALEDAGRNVSLVETFYITNICA